MKKRVFFSDFEDVRMLKWVARKNELGASLGVNLWRSYVETYGCEHTVQSLNGRMRRHIIPHLDYYIEYLRITDLISLCRIFGTRLGKENQKCIREWILKSEDRKKQTQEEEKQNETKSSENQNEKLPEKLRSKVDDISPAYRNKEFCNLKRILSLSNETQVRGPSRPTSTKLFEKETVQESLQETTDQQERRVPGIPPSLQIDNFSQSPISEIVYPGEEGTFCFRTWSMAMIPVAKRAVGSIHELMSRHIKSGNPDDQQQLEVIDEYNIQELFDKMVKNDERHVKKDIVVIDVESFPAKQLRVKYFLKMQHELNKRATNSLVQSAISLFFQYFEYYIAISFTDKNLSDIYILLMNRLVDVVIQLAML